MNVRWQGDARFLGTSSARPHLCDVPHARRPTAAWSQETALGSTGMFSSQTQLMSPIHLD
jgi:hypothetical protein